MLEKKTIEEYLRLYNVQWTVDMPKGCPPSDICIPSEHQFFRLALEAQSYSSDDFLTYSEMNPNKEWGEMLPLAVGLSVLEDESKARKSLKLPYLKKFKGIIDLTLNPTDGVVKQTGVHKSHYTWWRTTSFDTSDLKMLEQ